MKIGLANVAIVLSSVLILIILPFTLYTEIRWVGHALAGIISLLFSIVAAVVGAMLVGRIKGPQGVNLLNLHKKIILFLVAIIVGSFFYGLLSRLVHGEPFFSQHTEPMSTVIHGWFGLVVMIMAFAQILPCLLVKDRGKTRKLHMLIGYGLVVSLLIQTFLGILAALIEVQGL